MSQSATDNSSAGAVARTFRVPGLPMYVIGASDRGITVLSQQIRALNLAWGLTASREVSPAQEGDLTKVAIVGGGFAGLTAAAGLLAKETGPRVTLFERRDTLLPLQQGSDSRWLHPHIYDWPAKGSESFSAALPVLNWTAARASDVVVQVQRGWDSLLRNYCSSGSACQRLRVFCNTHHLRIFSAQTREKPTGIEIEWAGDLRYPTKTGLSLGDAGEPTCRGQTENFDIIILATGFGVERDCPTPYWRNETFGQPQLGEAVKTYIVSGYGDGAMIDLFRLCIAHYRQDRILAELFSERDPLLARLRDIDARFRKDDPPVSLYTEFLNLWSDPDLKDECSAVQAKLRGRVRRDTKVVLHVRKNRPRFADLFRHPRVSFQNRLLAFLLFRSGAFRLSCEDLETLCAEYEVPSQRVVIRHGTDRTSVLNPILSAELRSHLDDAVDGGVLISQPDTPAWPAGYFARSGPLPGRRYWHEEYLPNATQAITASFCSAVAGFLARSHPPGARLRVTFHRIVLVGNTQALQQCCEYDGICLDPGIRAASRTFAASHGTIGAGFVHRTIFRTRSEATTGEIRRDMQRLWLNPSSQSAIGDLEQSIATIPLISLPCSDAAISEGIPIGVLYLDSAQPSYFTDDRIISLVSMVGEFASLLSSLTNDGAGQIVNSPFWPGTTFNAGLAPALPDLEAMERVYIRPPMITDLTQINFDFSDFERVEAHNRANWALRSQPNGSRQHDCGVGWPIT